MFSSPLPDNPRGAAMELFRDLKLAVPIVARRSWRGSLLSWTFVPAGCLTVMAVCAGLKALLSLGNIKLPETVLCLVILFVGMNLLSLVLPKKNMEAFVRCLSIPLDWTLRYINLFFTPSFVMLPRTAQRPSGPEVGKIIGVFIVGYCIMVPGLAWFMRLAYRFMQYTRDSIHVRLEARYAAKGGELPIINPTSSLSTSTDVSPSSSVKDHDLDKDDEKAADGPEPLVLSTRSSASTTPSAFADEEKVLIEEPIKASRHERIADWLCHNLDILTYFFIFLFVGVPVFYAANYTMPAFLAGETVIFLLALRIPARPKKILHPVIVTTCWSILFIWLAAVTVDHRGGPAILIDELGTYKTGNNYLNYFTNTVTPGLGLPGAGDILSSLLDVGIVAFAMPMYKYRSQLLKFAIPLTLGVCTFCAGELLIYPLLTHAIGLAPANALAFAPRSLSLPLAVLATQNLEGNQNLNAVLAIMSGIAGALLGVPLLRWARIPEDDYMARGVSLGCNSSAIATAMLLETDITAAALSSLSMNFLGILMIILTLIPPVLQFVQRLAGW